MKIIVDAIGGDNAPRSNVDGALVGRGDEILAALKDLGLHEPPPGLPPTSW